MAVRTSSYSRSNSYSRPSTPQRSSAPSKPSTSKPSSSSPSKAPTPAPKRDTFTYSSPSASRNSAPKTNTAPKQGITPKQNTVPKTNNTTKQGITPKQNTAPKTNNTSKQGITPKQNTAPKTNNTSKQGITPKQNTAPKTNNTPKQGITPKQNTAPKTNNTPKQGIAPKQNTAPKTNNTPKQGITPKKNTAPKTNNTPKQGITPKQNTTPKTPTKPTTTNKSATTPQSKTPTKPAAKSNSASNKLTNDEYSQLAAKAAGVAIGSNGKPSFTSYEQSMKYAEVLTNLHKSGINGNSTSQEIAAASVGTKLDKNGKPIISNVTQGQNYGNTLNNIKSDTHQEVSYVNSNQSGVKPKPSVTGTITSFGYTKEEITEMEVNQGTKYVGSEVYGGNTNKYDPIKTAAKISGTNFTSLEQAQHTGGTAFKKFMNAYDPSYRLREENISRFVSYNQNGGWFDNGGQACKATSLAIVASINSDSFITPDKVGAEQSNGYLGSPISKVEGFDGHTYDVTTISDTNNVTPNQQLNKIKESLRQGKAISVEVTTNSGSQHWVVVTGTVDGCAIDNISSINDLIGIDPWHGSCSLNQNGNSTVNTNVNCFIGQ